MIDIIIPKPDPYAKLCGLIGGRPQVLVHADDLPSSGTGLTTWPGRGTVDGTITSADSGTITADWGGRRTFHTEASKGWVHFNSEATNYSSATEHLWVIALTPKSLSGAFMGLGSVSSGAKVILYGSSSLNVAAAFAGGSPPNIGAMATVTGTNNLRAIYTVLHKGGKVSVHRRTAAGGSMLINQANFDTTIGTINPTSFALGRYVTASAQSVITADIRFALALRNPGLDHADLPRVAEFVRTQLRCP